MTPPPDPQLDAVSVAVVALTAVAGGEIARYAGPYIVILAAALVGSVASIMRRPDVLSRWQSLAWVCWLTVLSLLLTGAVAAGLEQALLAAGWSVPSRYLLVPVSLGIAGVGHDWPAVAGWAAGLIRRRAERKLGAE